MTSGVAILATEAELASVRYDANGLVPAIAQDVTDGAVLMVAWMNAETLRLTLAEGRTVYWSRSRQEVWRKGDTSGEVQWVREAWYDCDADVLLFKVVQEGAGACHTGARSCFFRRFGGELDGVRADGEREVGGADVAAAETGSPGAVPDVDALGGALA
jgi:phosphoribosyl-AMP cyclohydrolase